MDLHIEGAIHPFIPLKAYQAQHGLPETFEVALFAPKDFTGLGRIDQAGAEMNAMRAAVVAAVPEYLPINQWIGFIPRLTDIFTMQLYSINHVVGLREVEIEFAAGGFSDVCHAFAYAALRAGVPARAAPKFQQVYHDWLAATTTTALAGSYLHGEESWNISVIYDAYGRVGLRIERGDAVDYVRDVALACPAHGYMRVLLEEVAAKLAAAAKKAQLDTTNYSPRQG